MIQAGLRKLALFSFAIYPLFAQTVQFCNNGACAPRNPAIKTITVLQQAGSRPRWSPDGSTIVFDRINADSFYDVYLMDRSGGNLRSLTENHAGIAQRNNGNAIFHPSGKYVVFLSEAPDHVMSPLLVGQSDPGIGSLSNFWATDLTGSTFWQLTNVPYPKTLTDPTPYQGVVNPNFSADGSQFVFSNRYGPGGGSFGLWRLMTAPFLTAPNPSLGTQRILFQPTTGNYVTSMGFLDATHMVVPGNLNGQNEYGMDENVLDTQALTTTNLTNTPTIWEEGACISPNKQWIVYMSNATSRFTLDFNNPNWPAQPVEREYWLMRADGSAKERLTYLNDSSAPEYLGHRVITAACDFSPDGRYIASTLGVDFGDATVQMQLKVGLIEMADPARFAASNSAGAPQLRSANPVLNAASLTTGFAAGSWVSLFGTNLAPTTRSWALSDFSGNNLPTSLDGVSVEINGKRGYLSYISPNQINVLAPDDTAQGPVTVQVITAGGRSPAVTAAEQQIVPAFFMFPVQGAKYIAAQHANFSLVGSSSLYPGSTTPAKPAETVALYGTGFGPTNPPAPAGQLVFGAPAVTSNVTATIGGATALVLYTGLVGPGLNQINLVVPNVPDGDQPVVISINGVQTQTNAFITVQR